MFSTFALFLTHAGIYRMHCARYLALLIALRTSSHPLLACQAHVHLWRTREALLRLASTCEQRKSHEEGPRAVHGSSCSVSEQRTETSTCRSLSRGCAPRVDVAWDEFGGRTPVLQRARPAGSNLRLYIGDVV
ncbi:hypothetical protein C8Q80DRAFT_343773 [Daedaleopsis nitida]|nr:hypothetical protein C8Q80DRAFT_343773 [Daedaleopsis nitida]